METEGSESLERKKRADFNRKAAVKPAVSTNVRNINLHGLKPTYIS